MVPSGRVSEMRVFYPHPTTGATTAINNNMEITMKAGEMLEGLGELGFLLLSSEINLYFIVIPYFFITVKNEVRVMETIMNAWYMIAWLS